MRTSMEKEHTWIKIRAQLPCLAALRSGQLLRTVPRFDAIGAYGLK